MRRVDTLKIIVQLSRAADLPWLGGSSNRPSSAAVADAIDTANRIARTLERMHTDECNGDHEKCPYCDGTGHKMGRHNLAGIGPACSRCNGTGRKSDREVAAFKAKRDRLEFRAISVLKSIGLAAEIERDPSRLLKNGSHWRLRAWLPLLPSRPLPG